MAITNPVVPAAVAAVESVGNAQVASSTADASTAAPSSSEELVLQDDEPPAKRMKFQEETVEGTPDSTCVQLLKDNLNKLSEIKQSIETRGITVKLL